MRLAASVALLAWMALAPSALAAQSLGSRVLRVGMSGNDVRVLQRLLTRAGFATPVTGVFGTITASKVAAFERKYQLRQNGVATRAVVTQLRNVVFGPPATSAVSGGDVLATPPPTTPAFPTLSAGSTGGWVRLLQRDLTFAGYATPVSGQYESATTQSVNSFKRTNGLHANGVFTPMAWTILQGDVQAVENTPPAGSKARLNPDGTVSAPANAPAVIQQVIAAANRIAFKPYIYGGGHGTWNDRGYDCSGSVSYALHGAGLISVPEDSSELESYGGAGPGQWITIWANAGHTYMEIAGLFFDTAAQSSSNGDDRWSTRRISPVGGFVVRHPTGY